jgi:nucleotide-binding universal stress UspA family protein
MKMILVPLDFSDAAAGVVDEAAKLATAIPGRIILMHVVRTLTALPHSSTEMAHLALATKALEATAEDQLGRIKTELRTRGIAVQTLRLTGNAATDIVAQAEKLGVDYVVMGSHGHSALYDLVIGSTTSAVLRRSRRPVVVVPAPKEAKNPRGRRAAPATTSCRTDRKTLTTACASP